MAIKYRDDPDLNFLTSCDNQDLDILAKLLTKDKNGKNRWGQELLDDPTFKYCNGNYKEAWPQIAGELQLFGGDSIINIARGTGVLYKEILCNVCDKLKVNYNPKHETSKIESYLQQKLISDCWEKMTEEQKKELLNATGVGVDANLMGASGLAAIIAAINLGGFAAYKTAAILANGIAKILFGKGLQIAANAALMRNMAVLAGPIGVAITALLTIPSITGAAYRVTIPCIIQVAYMRQKLLTQDRF